MNAEVLALRSALDGQRRRENRRWLYLLGFAGLAAVSLVLDIATGPSLLGVADVLNTLLHSETADATTKAIVLDMRLPIALMALVVGAALGIGGGEMQTLLDNPMASPFTLGLAAAAGLGAALSLYFGGFGLPPLVAIPLGAFVMCMLAASVLFGLALLKHVSSQTLILAGIALLFLFQSLLSLLQFLSSPELNQQILFWLFGSLTKTTWQTLAITTVVTAVCSLLLFQDAWRLTALRLGEVRARSLGVDVTRLRLKTLVLVALMTSTAISFVGVIGFIGLVAPHIARMLVGEDQRFFIPLSMLCGALLLSTASVLSKTIVPGALFPIGIVTAIIGVPFFFWLILGKRRRHA
ncbi:iron complex transport system permease protein [Rhodoferax ferrireducens]|uniref:Iron complex transport system permease protein n=1 Tax=Rhodoferax ferrireducens TaxID=192843 RepID=A0ABU2CDB6_9BURK|nr:iron ABC transporter permease [Rhodoferax ferrireducens]MDR7379329.1 iron complex transport system permease protein [Rhodoferax ferrireducens]